MPEIVCPYCGKKQEVEDWHDWFYHDQDEADYECKYCEQEFRIRGYINYPDFKVVKEK